MSINNTLRRNTELNDVPSERIIVADVTSLHNTANCVKLLATAEIVNERLKPTKKDHIYFTKYYLIKRYPADGKNHKNNDVNGKMVKNVQNRTKIIAKQAAKLQM